MRHLKIIIRREYLIFPVFKLVHARMGHWVAASKWPSGSEKYMQSVVNFFYADGLYQSELHLGNLHNITFSPCLKHLLNFYRLVILVRFWKSQDFSFYLFPQALISMSLEVISMAFKLAICEPGYFLCPPKTKISSCNAVQDAKAVCGPRNQAYKCSM